MHVCLTAHLFTYKANKAAIKLQSSHTYLKYIEESTSISHTSSRFVNSRVDDERTEAAKLSIRSNLLEQVLHTDREVRDRLLVGELQE